jgi:hypothetical protein
VRTNRETGRLIGPHFFWKNDKKLLPVIDNSLIFIGIYTRKGDAMETAVIMKRELFGREVSQNSKTGFFSATDLTKAGNAWRIANGLQPINLVKWFQNQSTKEFIETLEKEYGTVKISARGKGTHTWVHPFLFIDLALAMNPRFKVAVYQWLYDHLLKYRNDSGDSYKRMAGAIWEALPNKSEMPRVITEVARRIKAEVGVENWETATEEQLAHRDKIHEYVALFSDIVRERENLLETAFKRALDYVDSKGRK